MNKKEKHLERIISLFNQHGYWKIRVDDIARELKISKKTLYIEFENKKDIIRQSILHRIEKITDSSKKAEAESDNAIIAFFKILTEFYNIVDIEQDRENFQALQKYYMELFEFQIDQIYSVIKNVISNNYIRGIEEGLYSQEFDADFIGRYYALSYLTNRLSKYTNLSPKVLKQQKDNTIKLILNGMTTEKGKMAMANYYQINP
ncbi:MAG: TetR/AcrR family transcriptional regulator [Flavobacteriaceae bacterium]|nr:TetR/AcrR family transcriptional regulator [Flavobacteriaceae bacterium]